MVDLRSRIAEIPDFPTPGILFRDLLPLLAEPAAHAEVVRLLVEFATPLRPDVVIAAEARGFLFGTTLAHALGCAFAPARKPGKLPSDAWTQAYALEYGENALQLARTAIAPGMRVLIHDDLLATGGTASAAVQLLEKIGAKILEIHFLIELQFLQGRGKLKGYPVKSLITY